MPSINQTIVTGNLVADPELKKISSDNSVVNVRLLHNRRKRTEGGEWEDLEPVAYDLTIWGKSAEAFVTRCQKGSQLFLKGELEPNNYEKDDKKVYSYRLVVNDWQVIAGGKSAA